jgi:hypothetical protein
MTGNLPPGCTERHRDWADEMADQIATDLVSRAPIEDRLACVAARLRLIRQEGEGDGINRMANALMGHGKAKALDRDRGWS